MRRVVITGLGAVTPLCIGSLRSWNMLISGASGISFIPEHLFRTDDINVKVAGIVPNSSPEDIAQYISLSEQKRMDRFIHLGIIASHEAISDSGWEPKNEKEKSRTGVLIGSGIGGLHSIEKNVLLLQEKGPRKISPFFIPGSLINLASGHVSIRYGFSGPNNSVVTACATGNHAIGDAMNLIKRDEADVMICGGTESAICRTGVVGFAALRSLSTRSDAPEKASRPWDKDRDGFVMSEGAGILVLEELEHAKARGASIYAELIGYGMAGDAHHITSPHPDGRGACSAMKEALRSANINPEDVDYINAHGTSTPVGDTIEVQAVKKVFKDDAKKIPISSTKSSIGHLLGAAGGVESVFSVMAIYDQKIPPTLNLENPSPGCDLDFVPHNARDAKISIVLSNSFGFGGTNASLIFRKI
ncbi:MAG: beta-ketoacyl-ACP synthase II [Proteobacteria bacterium]|nr:beta-ketoacyl-ACP synthase II [Pseudomonadota bacterium]